MGKKRKIALVVNKVSFAEAEQSDNDFYAGLSHVERLEVLMDLRETVYGNSKLIFQKVISKRHINEKEISS